MAPEMVPPVAAGVRSRRLPALTVGGRGNRGGGGGLKAPLALAALPILFAFIQAPDAKKPSAPLKNPPRAYFAAHCQRCHGVDGGNFIPGFADEPDAKLRADIVRMAEGPGGAPLKPEDVDVQVAYHRLISAEKPFVSWTARDGLTLKGEMTDGAKLSASVGELKADDSNWTLVLPSDADFKPLKLTATVGKKTTELVPSETPFAKPSEKAPSSSPRR